GPNLFKVAVAYNGGPGNLNRWSREMPVRDDPLLFIESVPNFESRAYVEHVLTNLWIYRSRLGEETPTLDAVAAGGWPIYVSVEDEARAERSAELRGGILAFADVGGADAGDASEAAQP
ncbi:MAG: hypothetical protein AAF527_06280, partial [Pseudomonadota bacterium]